MFSTKNSNFDRLLEKATSKLLLDPDWDSTMQICDSIRQGDIQPLYALGAIKKKIENENPHVSKYALQVLESVVKNCGSIVHIEVATRDFMDFLKEQAKKRQEPVKGKIVELVQVWSHAFRNESNYKVVQETFNSMKSEGFTFPTLKESDAMFLSEKAPEWRDGEHCHRCRALFTTFNRKHHCRACGQVFCQKCSSKTSIIPKYGIEKEVRVCDACYDQISKPSTTAVEKKDELPAEYLASSLFKQPQVPASKSDAEIQEEEELQLALALSQSEAEAKEKHKTKQSFGHSVNSGSESLYSQPFKSVQPQQPVLQSHDTPDMDPELARYLDKNYWKQKSFEMKNATTSSLAQPSAPSVSNSISSSGTVGLKGSEVVMQKNDYGALHSDEKQEHHNSNENGTGLDEEREQFLKALGSSIEIFLNRMKSNSQRSRSIANDSTVQTLFMTLNAMHPTLLKYIQQQEDDRAHYESLQDKLSQLKDARDALDVLREEHKEKTRRKQEEMERLRQIQLAQKLEVLRQQKQVYLEYQRQMALQRMQEQEMEMRKRLEMQKHEQQLKAMQYGYPQAFAQTLSSPFQAPTMGQPYHVNHTQFSPGQQVTYAAQVYVPGMSLPPQQQQQLSGGGMPPSHASLSPQHQPHMYQSQPPQQPDTMMRNPQQQPLQQHTYPGMPQQPGPPAGYNVGYNPQLAAGSVMLSNYQPGVVGGADQKPLQQLQQPSQQLQQVPQANSMPANMASYGGSYYQPAPQQVHQVQQGPNEAELINFD